MSNHRRLPAFFDRLHAIDLSFSSYTLTLRGGPTTLDGVSSSGLVFRTAHLLILIAALKSRFTNSMRLSPLVELVFFRAFLVLVPSDPFPGLSALRAFASPRRSAPVPPSRSSKACTAAHLLDSSFLLMNALARMLR
jgi:hypothetical protein